MDERLATHTHTHTHTYTHTHTHTHTHTRKLNWTVEKGKGVGRQEDRIG